MNRLLTVLAILLLICTAQVQANTLAKMVADSGLPREDPEIMTGQAASLSTYGSLRVGDKIERTDSSRGTDGSVKVPAIADNCLKPRYFLTAKKKLEAQPLQMRRFKAAYGNLQME